MAEQIVNEFTVDRPIAEAWPTLCDLALIAPCLPGAQLDEVEGDVYRGTVEVRLGPITAEFAGEARFEARDDSAHRATLVAQGRGARGGGRASAVIEATAEAVSPTSTRCVVVTDLQITGKVAQLGRGVVGDVSKKLMDQFAANLDALLASTPSPAPVPPTRDPSDAPSPVEPSAGPSTALPPVTPAVIGAGPALKALAPVGAVVVLLALLLRRRARG